MKNLSVVAAVLVFAVGCGDNLQTPQQVFTLNPPTGLKALSVGDSSVQVRWSSATGSGDSTFFGYIVQAGTRRDTLSKATLSFTATALPHGESVFSIYSLNMSGSRSDAATIRWAPATRFDSVYSLYESVTLASNRPEGLNIGTTTTNPSVMIINLNDPVVQQTMDLFFNGDSAETQRSLSMWSANLRLATLSSTRFSTQVDGSPSLDFPLSAYPAENTFIRDSITVVDNAIYYVRVIGDPLQVNYARLHVHIRPGTSSPNRIIDVHISIQRVPGLLYALGPQECPQVLWHGLKLYRLLRS